MQSVAELQVEFPCSLCVTRQKVIAAVTVWLCRTPELKVRPYSAFRFSRVAGNMSIVKTVVRVLFAAFFIFAGITHFTNREFFIAIVPPSLPWAAALVYISGVAEIVLGTLLLMPATARLAGMRDSSRCSSRYSQRTFTWP